MAKIKNKRPLNNSRPCLGGRKPQLESKLCDYIYGFRLTKEENNLFQQKMKESGAHSITHFITNCIFNKPFNKVITKEESEKIARKISDINYNIRFLGVKYNQLTKAMNIPLTDKKTLSLLNKQEKVTAQITEQLKKIFQNIS